MKLSRANTRKESRRREKSTLLLSLILKASLSDSILLSVSLRARSFSPSLCFHSLSQSFSPSLFSLSLSFYSPSPSPSPSPRAEFNKCCCSWRERINDERSGRLSVCNQCSIYTYVTGRGRDRAREKNRVELQTNRDGDWVEGSWGELRQRERR